MWIHPGYAHWQHRVLRLHWNLFHLCLHQCRYFLVWKQVLHAPWLYLSHSGHPIPNFTFSSREPIVLGKPTTGFGLSPHLDFVGGWILFGFSQEEPSLISFSDHPIGTRPMESEALLEHGVVEAQCMGGPR